MINAPVPALIGLSGKSGSGKDTAASLLWKAAGYVRQAFASRLKKAVAEIYGFDRYQLHDPMGKNTVDPYWGETPRAILQRFGTEAVRHGMGQETWVKAAMRVLPTRACFTDVRFPNEADAIRARGGFLIRLEREGAGLQGEAALHPSETVLDDYQFDVVIQNNGTLSQLRNELVSALVRIGNQEAA